MRYFTNITRIVSLVTWLALASGAFAFDLTDTNGVRHSLAGAKGHWVVLNFWATWCVPCIQEIPEIAEFHKRHPEVIVLGVAVDVGDTLQVTRYAKTIGHNYPLVLSDEAIDKQLGRPVALPTTRIYDPAGNLVYDKPGRVTLRFLEEKTGSASRAQRAFHAFSTRFG